MAKKMATKNLPEGKKIQQVLDRLRLLNNILVNDFKLRDPDDEQRALLEGQRLGHANAILLLEQVSRRGELWLGGYLDNIGVVYTDQVQAHYEEQERLLGRA